MAEPLTGNAAALYVGAFMRSAEPDRHGLNAARLTRDAVSGRLDRLRLVVSSVGWRVRPVVLAQARPREHRPSVRRASLGQSRERGKPRPARGA